MYIENSIEISYSGEYETSLRFSAPSTTYPASLLGVFVAWLVVVQEDAMAVRR